MKSKVFILCFTILLIFGQIVFGQEKGVGNRTVSKLPAKEKRWALIIGVSRYEDGNITPLPGANNDARALRDALRDYAGFDEKQIITLTTDETKDRQPTQNNILRYLGNLKGTVPKDGLLLVAFSGHGIERNNRAFLLASDTPYNDNVKVLERTALSVTEDFKELIRDTGVGQVVILLDACRNDPSSGRSSSDNALTEAYKNGFSFDVRNREVEAFATLYATSIGERAYEYTRENKGYFTLAFIEALKGGAANEKGEVTLGGLIRYVEKYVPQQVKIDLGSNKLQRPFSIIEGYKADELVLGISKPSGNTIKPTETIIAQAPQPSADGKIEIKGWGAIPGLRGLLNPIHDSYGRTYLYAENIAVNGGETQAAKFSLNKPFKVEDADGNIFELTATAVSGDKFTFSYRRLRTESASSKSKAKKIKVSDENGVALSEVEIMLVFQDRTFKSKTTDSRGEVIFKELKESPMTLLLARQGFQAKLLENVLSKDESIEIYLKVAPDLQSGSLICNSTCYVPGLSGRLNPIFDDLTRRYLYADNISLNDGKPQPTDFELNRPIIAVDKNGNKFELIVTAQTRGGSRASLLNYRKL